VDDLRELGAIGCALLVIIGAIIVFLIFPITWVVNESGFPAQAARIEQLRHDAAHVDPLQAEDVIGQVTETNQSIVSSQQWNRVWLVGLVIPDGWDAIELIPVPR